jgi:molecular chaperone IbpA
MTLLLKTPSFDMFKEVDKFFVGFDDTYNRMVKFHDDLTKNIPNYPPYNIRKLEENRYLIEVAIAGFSKSDVEITFEDNKLTINGKSKDDKSEGFLFKGIANRAFTRTFLLDDNVEVKDADMMNGMLKIFLEKFIPEHKKPKKIEVKDNRHSDKQFLTENV